jgi:hypothetical protein
LLRVKTPANSSRATGHVWSFGLWAHVKPVWEFGSFTRSAVPLIESLKSKAHRLIDVPQRKNLTHLQSILLFKDSSHAVALTWVRICAECRLWQRNSPAAAGYLFSLISPGIFGEITEWRNATLRHCS